MDDLGLAGGDPLRVAPQHGEDEVVRRGERPEGVAEEGVEEVLLREGRRRRRQHGADEAVAGLQAGLVDEHTGVEVRRRRRAECRLRPRRPLWALLTVANLVLPRVAPGPLAEAVLDRVEVPVRQVKQMVNALEHLDVCVQVHHLPVLHELHHRHAHTQNLRLTKNLECR